jgi:hypothetical protein
MYEREGNLHPMEHRRIDKLEHKKENEQVIGTHMLSSTEGEIC